METKEEARNKFTYAKEVGNNLLHMKPGQSQRGIGAGLVSRENEDSAVFIVNTTVPGDTEVTMSIIQVV